MTTTAFTREEDAFICGTLAPKLKSTFDAGRRDGWDEAHDLSVLWGDDQRRAPEDLSVVRQDDHPSRGRGRPCSGPRRDVLRRASGCDRLDRCAAPRDPHGGSCGD